ncbi:MAG: hypothetical protein P1V97_33215, partial [Planctomycetota bacterium]|nr:hypothetical protein [Planctomycetota bacterium]
MSSHQSKGSFIFPQITSHALIFFFGLVGAVLWWHIKSLGNLRGAPLAYGIADYFGLIALYLGSLTVLAKSEKPDARSLILLILALGLGQKTIMLFQEPSLSDDIYRYLWEGRVVINGFNPFVLAPNSPELAHLQDDIWLGVNHKDIPAIYPPTMQGLFVLVAFLGGKFIAIKSIFVLFDLATALLVVKALRDRKKPGAWVLLYFWHPLLILEVAGQGHFEPVPVALLMLAFAAFSASKTRLSSIALWFSIGAKYLPIVFLPTLVFESWRRKLAWHHAFLGPVLLALAFYPFVETGWTSALSSYGTRWRFNDSGFWFIDTALMKTGFSPWFCRTILPLFKDPAGQDFGTNLTYLLFPAKLVVIGLIGILLLAKLWKKRSAPETAFAFFALFFFLSPVVHPWYLIWLLPLLPLFPRISWFYLT